MIGYLDDTFIIGDNFSEFKNVVVASVEIISSRGVFIHPKHIKAFSHSRDRILRSHNELKKMTVSLNKVSKQNYIETT